ncbi:hypothetical protein [Paenibacillus crassostreae]|uniref:Multi-TM2 domain-containing protein n=1 Tax=Paenibacillus crassostreae TaxID=1763538 RepID=A0A167DM56_9BACL|nr:hypothetical protein [Paenibacillus crassostreae]AOZ91290.1 hypothetical protein LPB68_03115 [Paenibacillus crassostreae]OAB74551.1 hypothetical protein PNBC_10845 [Paenibacillus crassostreae]
MQHDRNGFLAFVLNTFPGLGHYYLGRKIRGILYPFMFFGSIGVGVLLYSATNGDEFFALSGIGIALFIWCICMLDLIVALLRAPSVPQRLNELGHPINEHGELLTETRTPSEHSERFYTILLSFIPGLGHLQLGLMQRGLSFLIAFFGLATIMVFVTGVTNQSVFLLFLGVLPIIWVYCMFDAVQQINRKQAGELLVDRTLFEEFDAAREDGKRSKILVTLLSAFPGAGHMYLGLQKRGLQLMVLFLGSIYILDILRLSLFMFLVPVIWFYSFFDGLQQSSRYGKEPLVDRPIVEGIENHRGLVGIALLLIGLYYLGTQFIIPVLDTRFPEFLIDYRFRTYIQTFIVSLLLIGGGLKLAMGNKKIKPNPEKSRIRR